MSGAEGDVRMLLFDGSPTLPSAVMAQPDGTFLVGRDAVYAARAEPESFEPNPKRRVDEGEVLLGGRVVPVVELFAAVLDRVCDEARRVAGGQLTEAALTCPASWAQTRRQVLLTAAERAGLARVTLTPEPVAAASYFVRVHGASVPPGGTMVIYDLGAGTFDASVVRRTGADFDVLATQGLDASGGLEIDAAIVDYLGTVFAARADPRWERLVRPQGTADRRASLLLWEDVRVAKEILSRSAGARIHVPTIDDDVPLGREQLESLARPLLGRTVEATRRAIAAAGVDERDVTGLFLVGGASRIPLVATLLHQAFGRPPTVIEQPELVVAQGALDAAPPAIPASRPASARASARASQPVPARLRPTAAEPLPTAAEPPTLATLPRPTAAEPPSEAPAAATLPLPTAAEPPARPPSVVRSASVPATPPQRLPGRPPGRRPAKLIAGLAALVLVAVVTGVLLNRDPTKRGGQSATTASAGTGAVAAAMGNSAPPTGGPATPVRSSATTPSKEPATLPASYVGKWSGKLSESTNDPDPLPITVTLTAGGTGDKVGRVSYAAYCSGYWQLTAVLAGEVRLTESIDKNDGTCVETPYVRLTAAAGKLTVTMWDTQDYSGDQQGRATLTKQ